MSVNLNKNKPLSVLAVHLVFKDEKENIIKVILDIENREWRVDGMNNTLRPEIVHLMDHITENIGEYMQFCRGFEGGGQPTSIIDMIRKMSGAEIVVGTTPSDDDEEGGTKH